MVGRPTDPAPEEGPLLVLLERGACHGFCPIYWVRIAEDGGVLYEGREFVAVGGRQRARLDAAALAELHAALAGADFFALDERYTRRDYDGFPRVTTTHRAGGRERTVEHYLGDAGAPARLLELEEAIDRIAGTAAWIGEEDRGISGP